MPKLTVPKYTSSSVSNRDSGEKFSANCVLMGNISEKKDTQGNVVFNGEIKNKSKARLIRDGVVVYDGEISSIFREKNAVTINIVTSAHETIGSESLLENFLATMARYPAKTSPHSSIEPSSADHIVATL